MSFKRKSAEKKEFFENDDIFADPLFFYFGTIAKVKCIKIRYIPSKISKYREPIQDILENMSGQLEAFENQ